MSIYIEEVKKEKSTIVEDLEYNSQWNNCKLEYSSCNNETRKQCAIKLITWKLPNLNKETEQCEAGLILK